MSNDKRTPAEHLEDYQAALIAIDKEIANVFGGYTMKFVVAAVGMDADGELVHKTFIPKDQLDCDTVGMLHHAMVLMENKLIATYVGQMYMLDVKDDDSDVE